MKNLLQKELLPHHVGIILDGNGRWAEEKGQQRSMGHQEGMKRLQEIVEENFYLGIPILSLYVFSLDNWRRPEKEIRFLFNLMEQFYRDFFVKVKKKGIRVLWSGSSYHLDSKTISILEKVQKESQSNQDGILHLCFNYKGQDEIVHSAKTWIYKVIQGEERVEDMNIESFSKYFFQADLPAIDFLIRSSGEQRISDFLLWQIAYAELYFTSTYWPNFTKECYYEALHNYQNRKRRFGGI